MNEEISRSIIIRMAANFPALVLEGFVISDKEAQEIVDWIRNEMHSLRAKGDSELVSYAIHGSPLEKD